MQRETAKEKSSPPSIESDHQQLRRLVDELRATKDLLGLCNLLEKLDTLLESHFAREESADGLPRLVQTAATNKQHEVEEIFEEHREILAVVHRSLVKVKAYLDGPMANLRTDIQELCDLIAAHERREDRLLSDSVYQEFGGGD